MGSRADRPGTRLSGDRRVDVEDVAVERDLISSLVEKRVEGLLVAPIGDDHRFSCRSSPDGMPVVFIDRPPGQIEADTVLIDNRTVPGRRRST